jgi:serine/threonine-protein kinase HipA
MQNKVLDVLYEGRRVGRLAETPEKVLAFEYDTEWLRDGFSISPFHLPLEKRVFFANPEPFGGIFGVFRDSLPGGWGMILFNRMLRNNNIDPATVSALDRLAIVGQNGMGALEYKPTENLIGEESLSDLDTLAAEIGNIVNDNEYGKLLEELFASGGSSGGARPKVYRKIDGVEWLIKFRAGHDPKNIGRIEFDYMKAATAAGLIVPETRLFNNKYFATRRFDRKPNGEKVFMISASGLLEISHEALILDYNDLMKAAFDLTRDMREVEKMFRLMCFNVFSHNRDDHARNFSFLHDDGKWRVSPAYDLVYNSGIGMSREHATMIDGEGKNPTEVNIMSVAKKAGLPRRRAEEITNEVKTAVKNLKV